MLVAAPVAPDEAELLDTPELPLLKELPVLMASRRLWPALAPGAIWLEALSDEPPPLRPTKISFNIFTSFVALPCSS